MAGFVINNAANARFEGDFEIVLDAAHAPAEKAYVDRVNSILDALSDDEVADKAAVLSEARLEARRGCRKDAASRLRLEANEYLKGSLSVDIAADNALVIHGIYIANRNRLGRQLFEVSLEKAPDDQSMAVDLRITLTEGLPPPDNAPSAAKEELFVQIANTGTVITAVCEQMRGKKKDAAKGKRADQLLNTYMRKLANIAGLGLEASFTTLAVQALNQLRNEFVIQQAGRIKNDYVMRLGVVSGIATAPLLILYTYIVTREGGGWWHDHATFLVAGAGAAIGAWLSFSIRRVQLSFAELAVLEEDLLEPGFRVVFVIGLTIAACLLFWTGVMNIEIGLLKTNAREFAHSGSIALLIGLFCGISERALATAISGRAAAFVRGVGGG